MEYSRSKIDDCSEQTPITPDIFLSFSLTSDQPPITHATITHDIASQTADEAVDAEHGHQARRRREGHRLSEVGDRLADVCHASRQRVAAVVGHRRDSVRRADVVGHRCEYVLCWRPMANIDG